MNMSVNPIPLRKIGKNGPNVPALGFGLMVMSGAYGTPPSDEERFELLDRAYEIGERFWDTADMYGDNEELLGKWFKRTGKRDDIFLATKFGIKMDGVAKFVGIDSSAEYCKQSCEESLKKLGTDHIDLYYVHRTNPETPIEQTMRAMAELKAEGKIKYIGLSECSSNSVRRAYKIAPIDAVQIEYSPFVLDAEGETGTDIIKTCRELGITIICSSPLGRGLLTGTLTTKESLSGAGDFRAAAFPRFSGDNFEANVKVINQFKALAEKKGCSPSQLSIAWLLKQGEDIIPIPGTKRIKYLDENWNSLNVHLTDDEEAEIRKFVETADVMGHKTVPAAKDFDYAHTKEEA